MKYRQHRGQRAECRVQTNAGTKRRLGPEVKEPILHQKQKPTAYTVSVDRKQKKYRFYKITDRVRPRQRIIMKNIEQKY